MDGDMFRRRARFVVCVFSCFSPFGVLARRRGLELTELIGVAHVGVASGLCALALCFEISVLSRLIVILLLLCFGVQSVNAICRLLYLHMVVYSVPRLMTLS